jgi:hypothetical protein
MIVVILISSILVVISLNRRSENVMGVAVVEKVNRVYLSNMIPNMATVNQEYIFLPKIVYTGDRGVKIKILEGPTWLRIDSENVLRGYPRYEDIGVNKIVIEITDGIVSSEYIEYIVVNEDE